MATVKVTVTLDESQVKEIKSLVAGGRTANVSAFVQHAVRLALSDVQGWNEMLKESLAATGGPLTKEEREWAESVLNPPKSKNKSRRRTAA